MRIYFAHPYELRDELKPLIEKIGALGITVVDPFYFTAYSRELTERTERMLKEGKKTPDEEWDRLAAKVIAKDRRFIASSDALVAVFDGKVKLSVGTPMEVILAHDKYEIPVLVLLRNVNAMPRLRYHYWIRRHSDRIFESEDELLAELERMAGEER